MTRTIAIAVCVALGWAAASGCTPRATDAPPTAGAKAAPGTAPAAAPGAAAASTAAAHGHTDQRSGAAFVGAHAHTDQGDHVHLADGSTVTQADARRRAQEAEFLAELAAVHAKYGLLDESIQQLERSLALGRSLGSENAVRYGDLAKVYRAKKDADGYRRNLEAAIRVYQALHAAPERAEAADYYREQLAEVFAEVGNTERAVWWTGRIGEGKEPTLQILAVKARLYRLTRQNDLALQMLEQAEKHAPEGREREGVSLETADLLLSLRRTEEAETRLRTLARTATIEAVRTRAKRVLITHYDQAGKLDKLRLDDLEPTPTGEAPATGGAGTAPPKHGKEG